MDFVREHRPTSDSSIVSDAVRELSVRLALQARRQTAWASSVPWEVFVNEVLPSVVLNEARENWRPLLYDKLMPLVRGTSSITEAALLLNEKLWDELGVKYEKTLSPYVSAPLETMAYGRASCTGLSVLLVCAYRSVGIPARVALVGKWAPPHEGNHVWVEVWMPEHAPSEAGSDEPAGHWEFTGAFDGNVSQMNSTWFTDRVVLQDGADAAQRIYATTFCKDRAGAVQLPAASVPTGGDGPVYAVDQTSYYNSLKRVQHHPGPAKKEGEKETREGDGGVVAG